MSTERSMERSRTRSVRRRHSHIIPTALRSSQASTTHTTDKIPAAPVPYTVLYIIISMETQSPVAFYQYQTGTIISAKMMYHKTQDDTHYNNSTTQTFPTAAQQQPVPGISQKHNTRWTGKTRVAHRRMVDPKKG